MLPYSVSKWALLFCLYNSRTYYNNFYSLWAKDNRIMCDSKMFAYPLTTVFYSQSAVSLFFPIFESYAKKLHALFKTALFWKLQILLQRTAKKVLWNCPNMHITCKCFLSYKCAFLCFYTNLAQILGIVADILRRFYLD